jgi:hypothetical protein
MDLHICSIRITTENVFNHPQPRRGRHPTSDANQQAVLSVLLSEVEVRVDECNHLRVLLGATVWAALSLEMAKKETCVSFSLRLKCLPTTC